MPETRRDHARADVTPSLPAKLMADRRVASGASSSYGASAYGGKPGLGRTASTASSSSPSLQRQSSTSKYGLPPPVPAPMAAAPPPYTTGEKSGAGLSSAGSIKKAPPPPPPMKRAASNVPPAEHCVALFDFAAQVSRCSQQFNPHATDSAPTRSI